MDAQMKQLDDGQWVAEVDGSVAFGPSQSHRAVVEQFRATHGDNVPLLSSYRGMD
jgi:hypothetical protein